ncbi:BadF/BadG/BcrA/BcrD ATPase family protein [Fredinandcohnia sp. QZ13]|uniref:N-acetylglucosamine kinase n=1 Tax=Fredinandcohnia sp. QZ13 TaxID=3073144 RepID=UPI00285348CE|nr:BadF/BadG/BcrA/BcrD ATPase family protein [Fredinandcohnia sp. QZ13]MDR4890339.1 BadF/BadG/BcrA/BcrD ATPase family protein [Fredinandcohnia sp. QZ13]
MYVLGIDGGGTKTKGIIADECGNVYAVARVGATNQNGADLESIEKEFESLFSSLENQNKDAFNNLHTIFAGIAGVDRPEAKEIIKAILGKLAPSQATIIIDNDGVNALYSGTLGAPGIVQICGTGSITFGVNDQGERKRIGGWGYLIDDEGSSYELGREALYAIFKAYDKRGPKTALTEKIVQHFQIADPTDLISIVYSAKHPRDVIAPLSKYVTEAVDQGDEVAKELIRGSGNRIARSIHHLYDQLFPLNEREVQVVLVGGLFTRSDLFIPIIETYLQEAFLPLKLVTPHIEPVGGAVAAGIVQAGGTLGVGFKNNINEIIVQ